MGKCPGVTPNPYHFLIIEMSLKWRIFQNLSKCIIVALSTRFRSSFFQPILHPKGKKETSKNFFYIFNGHHQSSPKRRFDYCIKYIRCSGIKVFLLKIVVFQPSNWPSGWKWNSENIAHLQDFPKMICLLCKLYSVRGEFWEPGFCTKTSLSTSQYGPRLKMKIQKLYCISPGPYQSSTKRLIGYCVKYEKFCESFVK